MITAEKRQILRKDMSCQIIKRRDLLHDRLCLRIGAVKGHLIPGVYRIGAQSPRPAGIRPTLDLVWSKFLSQRLFLLCHVALVGDEDEHKKVRCGKSIVQKALVSFAVKWIPIGPKIDLFLQFIHPSTLFVI